MTDDNTCEVPKLNAPTEAIVQLLKDYHSIAVVGLSPNPERPSYGVASYLKAHGYKIIPVNPGHATILGEKSYRSLLDIPERVEIVDVFRRAEAVPALTEEAIRIKAKVLWLQEGIVHNEAAEKASQAGLIVVMNKCLLKEHAAHHS